MNFFRKFALARSNRKLHRDIVSSVRHVLAEDDDILTDEQKQRFAEFAKAADEARAIPELQRSADELRLVAEDYAAYTGRASFRAWMHFYANIIVVIQQLSIIVINASMVVIY